MVTFPDILEPPGPCPACQGEDWGNAGQVKDYSVSGEWFELKECRQCGLRMTYPIPEESTIGRYYASKEYISHSDTRSGLINKLFHSARNFMMKKKWRWVTSESGKTSGSLLDVGAGTGHFAHYMLTKGWDVIALEPDETARKVASEKLGIDIRPLEELASQEKSHFDVITLWHVLEHVHDIGGYLTHFHAILKPDGVLMIAVPNYTSTDAAIYGPKWAAYDAPRHLWHFGPMAMEKLLTRHGFNLRKKRNMPLDAFYVSMLSEKYRANYFWGPVSAFINGLRSWFKSRRNIDKASSILYTVKL